MRLSALILRLIGWRIVVSVPHRPKCVICVAPHTSNWDFIIGQIAYSTTGRRSHFLMKESWFFFPLGLCLRAMGGIPVYRNSGRQLCKKLTDMFHERGRLNLAIAPEGTRSPVQNWHTGFLRIAYSASIPVQCGLIDYKHKIVRVEKEFMPTGDIDSDMRTIREYFAQYKDAGRYPHKFII